MKRSAVFLPYRCPSRPATIVGFESSEVRLVKNMPIRFVERTNTYNLDDVLDLLMKPHAKKKERDSLLALAYDQPLFHWPEYSKALPAGLGYATPLPVVEKMIYYMAGRPSLKGGWCRSRTFLLLHHICMEMGGLAARVEDLIMAGIGEDAFRVSRPTKRQGDLLKKNNHRLDRLPDTEQLRHRVLLCYADHP